VKCWTFGDSSASALQLEYEAPFAVADTDRARRFAVRLWPAFAPYVEAHSMNSAIITATHLRGIRFLDGGWFMTMRHYGYVVDQDSLGVWDFPQDTVPLPTATSSVPPTIHEADGRPLPYDFPLPLGAP
jgi:hypothetical protein